MEFDIGDNLHYQAGDHLGVYPENRSELVEELAARPDERNALAILVRARSFADHHDVGLGVPVPEHETRRGRLQRTAVELLEGSPKRFKRRCGRRDLARRSRGVVGRKRRGGGHGRGRPRSLSGGRRQEAWRRSRRRAGPRSRRALRRSRRASCTRFREPVMRRRIHDGIDTHVGVPAQKLDVVIAGGNSGHGAPIYHHDPACATAPSGYIDQGDERKDTGRDGGDEW